MRNLDYRSFYSYTVEYDKSLIFIISAPVAHLYAAMPRRGPKTWTTPEEEAFLYSQLPAYIACQATKVYHNFWNTTIRDFLSRWPERARLTDIPQEGELSDIQKPHMAQAILKRKSVS